MKQEQESSDASGKSSPDCKESSPVVAFRSAFVALAGRPNCGKSTLMNTVLGEAISIVSSLPQTTRNNVKGIYNAPNLQLVFIDTPGIHSGKHGSNKYMSRESSDALRDSDILCYLVDLSRPFGEEEDAVAKVVAAAKVPVVIILNKKDICEDVDGTVLSFLTRYPEFSKTSRIVISANGKDSKDAFLRLIDPFISSGPAYFSEDYATDANLRFFAAEFIRKHLIASTRAEVPHAAFVEITEYLENPDQHKVEAVIYVESEGQKGIVIGKNGMIVKRIQNNASQDLKNLTGVPASIRCHIKVEPHWRDNEAFLSKLWKK